MDDDYLLSAALSEAEWNTIPQNIRKTLDDYFKMKIEQIIVNKALLETDRFNAECELKNLKYDCDITIKENNELKAKTNADEHTIKENEEQIKNLTNHLSKLQSKCNQLETEIAQLHYQRNLIIDERDEHLKVVQRRNNEIKILQLDLKTLKKQLKTAVNTKCEALAEAEEVSSLKLRLEYCEKRIDREKILLNEQISILTTDLQQKNDELLNMKKDHTLRCIQLESIVAQKSQELVVSQEHIKSLTDLNTNLSQKYEELTEKLSVQRENNVKINESYLHEIESKNTLANTYKVMYEENQHFAEIMKNALDEVQQLLKSTIDEYGELETQKREAELTHEEVLAKKNDFIDLLKKEIEIWKEATKGFKNDSLLKDSKGSSQTVLRPPDTNVTESNAQYVTINEKLSDLEKENIQLKNNCNILKDEVNEQVPIIKELRDKYFNIIEANKSLTESNNSLLNEVQQLRKENNECLIIQNTMDREKNRLKKEVSDLNIQICHLLQQIEHSKVSSSSSTSTHMDLSDNISLADMKTEKLVTFNDILELQKNNSKLLCVVRELTEQQKAYESVDPASIDDLHLKLNELMVVHKDLLIERENQNKMMVTLSNQRDMYKNFYIQANKSVDKEIMKTDNNEDYDLKNNTPTDSNTVSTNEKINELQNEIKEYKKKIEIIKAETEIYLKGKTDNEKILLKQMNEIKNESYDLIKLNCQLTSENESNKERFKIAQNNIDIFKKQMSALEQQNKIDSEKIAKHEQIVVYLKNAIMEAQARQANAELILGNLQKENALLKDAENHLLEELHVFRCDSHAQTLMKNNIESIKATLERNDAESKLKLESRIDEAHRECSALRRLLQKEQNHFRELSVQLKKQTDDYSNRIDEANKEADRLRNEILTLKDDIESKQNHINELIKKIKSPVFKWPENSNESDNNKILELQKQITDHQAEIESLNTKYKITKEASEQYRTIACNAETELKILLKKEENYQKDIDQYKDKILKLENEFHLQMVDKNSNNLIQSELEEELNMKKFDLNSAREQLETVLNENKLLMDNLKAVENKYECEVMLHSNNLQLLETMKGELDIVKNELIEAKNSKELALKELNYNKDCFNEREISILNDKNRLEERCNVLEHQNNILLDEIQTLNTKLSLIQTNSMTIPSSSSASLSMATKSIDSNETQQDEIKLLKVIKSLRNEKDMAVNKAEILEAEHYHLKNQNDIIQEQYNKAKQIIENERQNSNVSTVLPTKHAEILRKIETVNVITDSNKALRQERDALKSEIAECKLKIEQLETELMILQDKNKELGVKAETMQTENISLRGECTKKRRRAQMVVEKSHCTCPKYWKKLQNERETQFKQLTLNDELNNIKQEKNQLTEEINRLKDENTNIQNQLNQKLQELNEESKVDKEQIRSLNEVVILKENAFIELKRNFNQIRKIAKNYKIMYEDLNKKMVSLNKESNNEETKEQSSSDDNKIEESRSKLKERLKKTEQSHKKIVEKLNQQLQTSFDETENYKKEFETLKQDILKKEDRFVQLLKKAKDRIETLREQNNNLKSKINHKNSSNLTCQDSNEKTKLLEKINNLEKENANKKHIIDQLTKKIENLMQKLNHLQLQLCQQGSKPGTSSGSLEKPTSKPPTANIKPLPRYSNNLQTQSVQIHPRRIGSETPLPSIRPMSAQLRTSTGLPCPSVVMIASQPQVHTTSTNTIEALSSSLTSSHGYYVRATSSARIHIRMPRRHIVSSSPTEDGDNNLQIQHTPQQQVVALEIPRVESPNSGPTQEQGTSSSRSNTETTTQGVHKRQRESDTNTTEGQTNISPQNKRICIQQIDGVKGADKPDNTEGNDIEVMEQEGYEDADCLGVSNEVEIIKTCSEVSNLIERSVQDNTMLEENIEQIQAEATSCRTKGTVRSVLTLQSSPQESVPSDDDQASAQLAQNNEGVKPPHAEENYVEEGHEAEALSSTDMRLRKTNRNIGVTRHN